MLKNIIYKSINYIYSWIKNFFGFESIVSNKIDSILSVIEKIDERINQMALNLDALTLAVEQTKGVQDSAITLLHHLTEELSEISAKLAETPKEMPVDTSGLDALVAKLKDSTAALADAVAANSHDHSEPVPAPVMEELASAPVVEEPVMDPAPADPVEDPETPVDGAPV